MNIETQKKSEEITKGINNCKSKIFTIERLLNAESLQCKVIPYPKGRFMRLNDYYLCDIDAIKNQHNIDKLDYENRLYKLEKELEQL